VIIRQATVGMTERKQYDYSLPTSTITKERGKVLTSADVEVLISPYAKLLTTMSKELLTTIGAELLTVMDVELLTTTDAELLTTSIDSESIQAWSEIDESKRDEGCKNEMLLYIPLAMMCMLIGMIIFAFCLVLIFKRQRKVVTRRPQNGDRNDSVNQSSYVSLQLSEFAVGNERNCVMEFPQV
jgi:cell division protein FtsL